MFGDIHDSFFEHSSRRATVRNWNSMTMSIAWTDRATITNVSTTRGTMILLGSINRGSMLKRENVFFVGNNRHSFL
jgi:hypothetical protein